MATSLYIYDTDTENIDEHLFDSWDEAENAACDMIDYDVEAWLGHVSDREYRHHEMKGEDAKEELRNTGTCNFYEIEYSIVEH